MTRLQLYDKIRDKQSFLCVGLDTDLKKIPKHLLKEDDPLFAFNKAIIDATEPFAVAYKPNLAFYEAHGAFGMRSLERTMKYIPDHIFKIADAKRGDIGNTATMYAKAFFDKMKFDAVTVSPYMGEDSVTPFLEFDRKWVIILAATSNPGSLDFQHLIVEDGSESLHERVIRKSRDWGNKNNTMFVVGATRVESLVNIRRLVPDHFLLIPGVGAQGGDLAQVCKFGLNSRCGLLINSSRSILYADDSENFAEAAATEAKKLQVQMAEYLQDL